MNEMPIRLHRDVTQGNVWAGRENSPESGRPSKVVPRHNISVHAEEGYVKALNG